MRVTRTERGFEVLGHQVYPECDGSGGLFRLVQQSSAVGPYNDARKRPGSSFLWVGERHHLDREEVRKLVGYLQRWLDTGSLREAGQDLAATSSPPGSD